MKKIVFFIFVSISSYAQTDSLKTTFSMEEVEKFEKPTLIDEYDKAFGGNRLVKSSLRFRFNLNTTPNGFTSFGIVPHFEQKIGLDFSVIGSVLFGYRENVGLYYENGVEGRWYYGMKKRINTGKQKANITGNFISIKGMHSSKNKSEQYSVLIQKNNGFSVSTSINPFFLYKNSLSVLWGKQLGNNVDFGFIGGLKNGTEFINSNPNFFFDLRNPLDPLRSKTVFIPYFSTFSKVGFGFMFPRTLKNENDKCEFLKCNYTVNRMLKFNLNDAAYIDKYQQNLKTDIGIEQRIAKSNFTINIALEGSVRSYKTLEVISKKDTVMVYNGIAYNITLPFYSNKNVNDITYALSKTTQLRYYHNKKGSLIKNLNGSYSGVEYNLKYRNFILPNVINNFSPASSFTHNVSVILGHQTQTSVGTFLDFTAAVGLSTINPSTFINNDLLKTTGFRQLYVNFGYKLGLAR